MKRNFNCLRIPVHRSNEGRVLGVFRGLADHVRFPVVWTRVLGVMILLGVGGSFENIGGNALIAACILYILLALLMLPPAATTSAAESLNGFATDSSRAGSRLRPVFPVASTRPAVDLAALERQLDVLSRRIARMENIVVTREADWERRLGT